ncbi:MAG: AsmA-like C-terminal region-containing protein, partial [Gammaproteobacteria bacterium]|nr:AsmA-like C-terminal region-containing protein [Gammaproteobacteria bacterium]
WVNATVEKAKGTLEIDANAITMRDVSFTHGTGAGTGSGARRFGAGGQPDTIEATFQLREVNADLIEGLFMGDTRDLDGLFDATGSLAFPMPAGDTPVRNGMNGTIRFQAVNGTLGKAGLISKLLTALRTTDILRLRIPQLRDRGLTFNTLSGSIAMENGVFHLAPYTMADSTYVLEADALLDYPRDIASGTIEIQVLEGVTGVTRRIPFLGEAAGMVSKVFSVPIRISGAASDPAFRPGISGP